MEEYTNEFIVDQFLDNIRYLKIAHHVTGRIRVKATWSGAKKLASEDTDRLESIIARIPGITEYRVNKKALSVAITYDPGILPYELWEDVGKLGENPVNRDGVKIRLMEILEG